MAPWPTNPIVYEINSHLWLAELARKYGRPITLQEVPVEEFARFEEFHLDAIWLMGVWTPSPAGRRIALRYAKTFREALPDLKKEDVIASPFAVYDYSVDPALGGEEGLKLFRERLHKRGIRLMLDFISNHMAVDHPWTVSHPERLFQGSIKGFEREPELYFLRRVGQKNYIFAHGRDPNFPPWTDTVQIDYSSPETRAAMVEILEKIAALADGARCDMAMLITGPVFQRTWRLRGPIVEFWPEAISRVKARRPDFIFLGEVYWGLERELQKQGFDFVYDKTLYDRLLCSEPEAVRAHLRACLPFQSRLARFIENHDERRALDAFGPEKSKAAAAVIATLPGLRLFHEGQFEGRRVHVPVQLQRRPEEEIQKDVEDFYRRLLGLASGEAFRRGAWILLGACPAEDSDPTWRNLLTCAWQYEGKTHLVAVNLGRESSRARVSLPAPGFERERLGAQTLMSTEEKNQPELRFHLEFEVELEPYGVRIFNVGSAR